MIRAHKLINMNNSFSIVNILHADAAQEYLAARDEVLYQGGLRIARDGQQYLASQTYNLFERAVEAARAAIDSPLLELSIAGAKGLF